PDLRQPRTRTQRRAPARPDHPLPARQAPVPGDRRGWRRATSPDGANYAGGGRGSRLSFSLSSEPPSTRLGVLATVAEVAASTALVYPLKSVAPAVSLGVVYIPGVLLIGTVWGWRLGLVSAVVSALAFNWFHIPPTGRFEIATDRDLVALVVFVIVAVASSTLAELARARAAEAE